MILLLTSLALAKPEDAPTPLPASAPVVVWMEPALPSAEQQARLEKLSGRAQHVAWPDLAVTFQPFEGTDEARVAAVKKATQDARGRQDQFDVEATLAQQLASAIEPVAGIRSEPDRIALVEALVVQGRNALWIVPEARFAAADEVAAQRTTVAGAAVPSALVDAVALEPERVWVRNDVGDAETLRRVQQLVDTVKALPSATVSVDELPEGAQVVIDGRVVADGAALLPGRHYGHVLIGDRVGGRFEQVVEAGATVRVAPTVDRAEIITARARVLEDLAEMPPDVAAAASAFGTRGSRSVPVFLAALDDRGVPKLVPFANGARIDRPKPVSVILGGALGGGIQRSSAYVAESGLGVVGEPTNALLFGGNLDLTFGVYNLAIFGGTHLGITPTETMKIEDAEGENVALNMYVRPHGGFGVYLPRPRKDRVLGMVGGYFGWQSPGAMGFGAKASVGFPMGGDGTWLRVEFDGFRGVQMAGFPEEGTQTSSIGLRVGFGRML